jgi:signal transduction histidine kinase
MKEQQKKTAPRKRLLVQLGTPILLFALAVFIVLGIEVFISFDRERTEALSRPQTILRSADREITGFFKSLERDARIAATSAAQDLSFSSETRFFLQSIVKENTAILRLVFIDDTGEEIISFVEPTAQDIFGEEEYTSKYYFDTIKSRGEDYLFAPELSAYNTPIVTWAFPVRDSFGKLRGVMNATIDVSALWVIISSYRETNPGELYIIDDKGTLLVSNDFTDVETQTSLLSISGVKDFLEGERGVIEYVGLSGTSVAGVADTVPPTSWRLIVEISLPELLDDARQKAVVFLFFIGVLLLLFFYELYKFNRVLMRPLDSLTRTTELIAKGDLSRRAEVINEDEIGYLAKTFNSMIEKLERIDRAKSEFISIASHQLRTPMTSIQWSIERIMKKEKLTEKGIEYLGDIHTSIKNLNSLVNDLLNISRLEAGRLKIEPKPTQLEDFIEKAIMETQPLLDEKVCTVSFKRPKKKLPLVSIDTSLLNQVVHNFLMNSIQYSLKGECDITIGLEHKDKEYVIWVADKGIGIPKETQSRITEKFFRADNAMKLETNQSGLGLYVVKMISDEINARMWFESEEGKGTTFYVAIPEQGMKEKKGEKKLT